jgi:hypothetical protein
MTKLERRISRAVLVLCAIVIVQWTISVLAAN